MEQHWTKRSYDALFDWPTGPAGRDRCRLALKADGLTDVLADLEQATNLGVWYRYTTIAATAVGPHIVEQVAHQAQQQLETLTGNQTPPTDPTDLIV